MTTIAPIDVEESEAAVLIDLENIRLSWEKTYGKLFRYTDLCWLCELAEQRFRTSIGRIVVFMSDPKECEDTMGAEQLAELKKIHFYLKQDQMRSQTRRTEQSHAVEKRTGSRLSSNNNNAKRPRGAGQSSSASSNEDTGSDRSDLECSVPSDSRSATAPREEVLVLDLDSDSDDDTSSSPLSSSTAVPNQLRSHSPSVIFPPVVLPSAPAKIVSSPPSASSPISPPPAEDSTRSSFPSSLSGSVSESICTPEDDDDDVVVCESDPKECLSAGSDRSVQSVRSAGSAPELLDSIDSCEKVSNRPESIEEEEPWIRLGVKACPKADVVVRVFGYKMSGRRRVQRCCDVAIGSEVTKICFMARFSSIILFSADSDFEETATSCAQAEDFGGVIKYAKKIRVLGFSNAFASATASSARRKFIDAKREARRRGDWNPARKASFEDDDNMEVSVYLIEQIFPEIWRVLRRSPRPNLPRSMRGGFYGAPIAARPAAAAVSPPVIEIAGEGNSTSTPALEGPVQFLPYQDVPRPSQPPAYPPEPLPDLAQGPLENSYKPTPQIAFQVPASPPWKQEAVESKKVPPWRQQHQPLFTLSVDPIESREASAFFPTSVVPPPPPVQQSEMFRPPPYQHQYGIPDSPVVPPPPVIRQRARRSPPAVSETHYKRQRVHSFISRRLPDREVQENVLSAGVIFNC